LRGCKERWKRSGINGLAARQRVLFRRINASSWAFVSRYMLGG
jgi:hypothetical protein